MMNFEDTKGKKCRRFPAEMLKLCKKHVSMRVFNEMMLDNLYFQNSLQNTRPLNESKNVEKLNRNYMQAIDVRRVVILPAPQIYDVRIVNKNSADAYITDAYETNTRKLFSMRFRRFIAFWVY